MKNLAKATSRADHMDIRYSIREKLADFLSVAPEYEIERETSRGFIAKCSVFQEGDQVQGYASQGLGYADTRERAKDLALVNAIVSLAATDFLIEEYEAEGYERYIGEMTQDGLAYKTYDEWDAEQI